MDEKIIYRPVLAIDVEHYSRRDDREQMRIQQALQRVLDEAAKTAHIKRDDWYRQPNGDGELAVLPEGVDLPALVGDFTRALAGALARVNREGPGGQRLRLRVAIHHGTVAMGQLGTVGAAPIEVSRLLDSQELRQFLAMRDDATVALVVSDAVYRDVVESGFCALNPTAFRPIRTKIKGAVHRGHIHADALHRLTGDDLAALDDPEFAAHIEASSLGTPNARALQAMADQALIDAVLRRVRSTQEPQLPDTHTRKTAEADVAARGEETTLWEVDVGHVKVS
jgi:class 3 adenylate cyclase